MSEARAGLRARLDDPEERGVEPGEEQDRAPDRSVRRADEQVADPICVDVTQGGEARAQRGLRAAVDPEEEAAGRAGAQLYASARGATAGDGARRADREVCAAVGVAVADGTERRPVALVSVEAEPGPE